MTLTYMPGFGNDFETEALPGALPQGQNSPQRCAYGLYAEQLSGSPFTAPRGANERSWLYRIRPSVRHTGRFKPVEHPHWKSAPNLDDHALALGQLRWSPIKLPEAPTDFVEGIRTMTTAGDVNGQAGMAAHAYAANRDMIDTHFFDADGELLLVPEQGRLRIRTEMGVIEVEPAEICVIPRGMVFRVELPDGTARGYICENYGAKFTLPGRGPIGANCLANPRDFKTPVAWFEERDEPTRLLVKWCGKFHETRLPHSPLDVVAWHGNYAPYKYDLRTYSPVGAILFDHPDPSIFTVLTAPSGEEGTANIDFVIFPPRWLVAEHSFRPPWYHRNIMSEFMGLIYGRYDAKEEGFVPGGMSLHNLMLAHGPDAPGFWKASTAELKPQKLDNTMAFMFETRFPQHLTRFAAELDSLQSDYADCWKDLRKRFNGTIEGDWERMKLATLKSGSRDGRLVAVSRDLTRATDAARIAPTLQAALDDWRRCGPELKDLAESLEHGAVPSERFHEREAMSPLPRAYQWADGSAYVNHVELVRKARGAEMPESFWTDPLMYQGGSDCFLGPRDPIAMADEAYGIDMEGEIAVIVGDVPMASPPAACIEAIRLVMLVNDVSLRNLIPAELAKGFGFFQSKPSSAFSPVAVTPDELGEAWSGGKLHLPLIVDLNGKPFGRADAGADMTFDFGTLIAHAAKTRPLAAGTIIGSGTVSNRDRSGGPGKPISEGGLGYSCIAEIRMIETIAGGKPQTPFMRFGDTVRIEMKDKAGHSIFGAIEQPVKKYEGAV